MAPGAHTELTTRPLNSLIHSLTHSYRLPYLCNGYLCYYICIYGVFFVEAFFSHIWSISRVYDKFGEYLTAAVIVADVTSLFWYLYGIKISTPEQRQSHTGNVIYDFFMGTILYPRVGPIVDIKMIAEVRLSTHFLIPLVTHSLTHSIILTYSLTLTLLLTHSLTYLLTYSLILIGEMVMANSNVIDNVMRISPVPRVWLPNQGNDGDVTGSLVVLQRDRQGRALHPLHVGHVSRELRMDVELLEHSWCPLPLLLPIFLYCKKL